jgi:hypothetical protein
MWGQYLGICTGDTPESTGTILVVLCQRFLHNKHDTSRKCVQRSSDGVATWSRQCHSREFRCDLCQNRAPSPQMAPCPLHDSELWSKLRSGGALQWQ